MRSVLVQSCLVILHKCSSLSSCPDFSATRNYKISPSFRQIYHPLKSLESIIFILCIAYLIQISYMPSSFRQSIWKVFKPRMTANSTYLVTGVTRGRTTFVSNALLDLIYNFDQVLDMASCRPISLSPTLPWSLASATHEPRAKLSSRCLSPRVQSSSWSKSTVPPRPMPKPQFRH